MGMSKARTASAELGPTVSRREGASLRDRVIVLCILPTVQMLMSLYLYACLPLYLLEQGHRLINIGIFTGLALLTRSLLPIVLVKYVRLESVLIPIMSTALVSGFLNCIYPDRLPLINLNIYCQLLLPARCVYQAAAVKVWPAERVKALRVYESFYTVGYCLSSLWGAFIYSLGGWRLCMWCQTAVLSVAVLLAFSVPVLRPGLDGKPAALESQDGPGPPGQPAQDAAQGAAGPAPGAGVPSAGTCAATARPAAFSWRLALFLGLGPAVTIFAYASEWSIYLFYLTDKFGLGVLPIGAGQTAGDIGGALLLMASMLSSRRPACTTASRGKGCGRRLCSLPFSVVWLSALYVFAFLAFVSDTMGLAIAGQVVMGTMYVLLQQSFTELVEWCSRSPGNQDEPDDPSKQGNYQRFAAIADACFSLGAALGSYLPFVILEKLSAAWVCYIAAGLVASYGAAFAAVCPFVRAFEQMHEARSAPRRDGPELDL